MKPDMSVAHGQDGNSDTKTMLDDSDHSTKPSDHPADTNADPEKGQISPPPEKEGQVRAITGFKVGDTSALIELEGGEGGRNPC